ncbi:hypothetical protein ACS0TY_028960 [Phlomoides rotata]
METPSSSRRVTRSQTLVSSALLSKKVEDSEKTMTKSKKNQQQDRSALIDITNDSPIVGLAMGSLKTPSSAMSKKRVSGGQFARTPGSGEALLRGQVKTLLQKVEEEAELSKITLEKRPFFNLAYSPMNLVAPTPANTPQFLSANTDYLPSVTPVTDKFLFPQMLDMVDEKKQESDESEALITRSLLLDFSEKSDSSDCTSALTIEKDDDDASVWSIQVNASSTRDEEEDEDDYEYEDEEDSLEDDDDEYYYDEGGDNLDDLCEEMSKISVEETRFMGKHIRFVYNSDDEIEKEQVFGVLRLKGLPTPKGKHLRFAES